MTNKQPSTVVHKDLTDCTTDELVDVASMYGVLDVFGSERHEHPHRYHAVITFHTIKHTEMKARSDHGLTFRAAIIEAIENARHMVALAKELQS